MSIISWFNDYSVILTLLLGVGSLITTILYVAFTKKILLANNKSANMAERQILQAQESIQMMVDVQLYEKRLEIANNIENKDYSNTDIEIAILFNKEILIEINSLKKMLKEQADWEKKYASYLEERDKHGLFDYNLDYEVQSGMATQEMTDIYIEMLEKCNRIYIDGYDPDFYYYDFQEIRNNLSEINENVERKQKEINNIIYSIMKEQLTVEQ